MPPTSNDLGILSRFQHGAHASTWCERVPEKNSLTDRKTDKGMCERKGKGGIFLHCQVYKAKVTLGAILCHN